MKRLLLIFAALCAIPGVAFAHPPITKGSTSVIVPLVVVDSSSSTGARLASVAFNASPAPTCYYRREGGTSTAITLAAGTVGTWSSGGWIYDTNTKQYELGVPDAAFATGGTARYVVVTCYGATNMLQVDVSIPLTDFGPYSTGTAQAVGASTITLAASDVSGDNALGGAFQVTIDSATTGANQSMCICSNVSSSKVATLAASWPVSVTGTAKYSLSPNAACRAVCTGVPAVNGNVTGSVLGSGGGATSSRTW